MFIITTASIISIAIIIVIMTVIMIITAACLPEPDRTADAGGVASNVSPGLQSCVIKKCYGGILNCSPAPGGRGNHQCLLDRTFPNSPD